MSEDPAAPGMKPASPIFQTTPTGMQSLNLALPPIMDLEQNPVVGYSCLCLPLD